MSAGPPAKRQKKLLDAARLPNDSAEQGSAAEHDPFDELELPSDVEAAIQFLRQEFLGVAGRQGSTQGWPPLVLTSQLRSIVKDQRSIDAEVEALRQRNVIRLLKLPTGVDEHGLLLTSDYTSAVTHAVEVQVHARHKASALLDGDAPTAKQPLNTPATQRIPVEPEHLVADAFCKCVLPSHTEVSISQSRLLSLMNTTASDLTARASQAKSDTHLGQHDPKPATTSTPHPTGVSSIPQSQQLGILLQLGVISRHPGADDTYLLWCPDLGPVIKSVMAGRKELLGIITRKKQAEVPERNIIGSTLQQQAALSAGCTATPRAGHESEGGFIRPLALDGLESGAFHGSTAGTSTRVPGNSPAAVNSGRPSGGVKLRQSPLGVMFHLRDLIGRGDVIRITSTAGALLKVVKPGG